MPWTAQCRQRGPGGLTGWWTHCVVGASARRAHRAPPAGGQAPRQESGVAALDALSWRRPRLVPGHPSNVPSRQQTRPRALAHFCARRSHLPGRQGLAHPKPTDSEDRLAGPPSGTRRAAPGTPARTHLPPRGWTEVNLHGLHPVRQGDTGRAGPDGRRNIRNTRVHAHARVHAHKRAQPRQAAPSAISALSECLAQQQVGRAAHTPSGPPGAPGPTLHRPSCRCPEGPLVLRAARDGRAHFCPHVSRRRCSRTSAPDPLAHRLRGDAGQPRGSPGQACEENAPWVGQGPHAATSPLLRSAEGQGQQPCPARVPGPPSPSPQPRGQKQGARWPRGGAGVSRWAVYTPFRG